VIQVAQDCPKEKPVISVVFNNGDGFHGFERKKSAGIGEILGKGGLFLPPLSCEHNGTRLSIDKQA
jgi:hypothetical protein